MNLVCLIAQKANELAGKRVLVYSFGSGALATMFQITGRKPTTHKFTLERMASTVNLMDRLLDRETVTPEELSEAIRIREKNVNRGGFVPQYSVSSLFPGTFYLEEVRPDFTRVYLRKPPTAPRIKGLFYPVHGSKVIMVEKILTPREGTQVLSPQVREVDMPSEHESSATPSASSSTTAVAPPLSSSTMGRVPRAFTFPAQEGQALTSTPTPPTPVQAQQAPTSGHSRVSKSFSLSW